MHFKLRWMPSILIGAITASMTYGETMSPTANGWTYICLDRNRTQYDILTQGWERWFGMGVGDATGDHFPDIVSGKWFYQNPGSNPETSWKRSEIGYAMDGILITDVDGDASGDIIALRCNEQFWLEAEDIEGTAWKATLVGELPICNHGISAQGYAIARLFGTNQHVIISNHDGGLFLMEIPDDPETVPWPTAVVTPNGATEKGMVAGDADGDGDLDIFTACALPSHPASDRQAQVCWFENPGKFTNDWTRHEIGDLKHKADRFALGDLNGDGREDLVVSEGRWPGSEPDASVYWFERSGLSASPTWTPHHLLTGYSMNSLSIGDMDQDGDPDIIVAEHKGPAKKLWLLSNNGGGEFVRTCIDAGKENHIGARLADFDQDGDLDITGFGWDDFQFLHLWRNDLKK